MFRGLVLRPQKEEAPPLAILEAHFTHSSLPSHRVNLFLVITWSLGGKEAFYTLLPPLSSSSGVGWAPC